MDFMGLFALVSLVLTFLMVKDKELVVIGPLTLFILSGAISLIFSLTSFTIFLVVALTFFLIIYNVGEDISEENISEEDIFEEDISKVHREDFYIRNLESAVMEREELFEKIRTFEKKAEMEEEPSVREYLYRIKRDIEGNLSSRDRKIADIMAEIRRSWD